MAGMGAAASLGAAAGMGPVVGVAFMVLRMYGIADRTVVCAVLTQSA